MVRLVELLETHLGEAVFRGSLAVLHRITTTFGALRIYENRLSLEIPRMLDKIGMTVDLGLRRAIGDVHGEVRYRSEV